MSNGMTYHFAVTAYSYLADNEGSPFKTLESSEARVSVTPHSTNPGVVVHQRMDQTLLLRTQVRQMLVFQLIL